MVQRKFATSRRFEYLDAVKFKKRLRQFVSARGFLSELSEADLYEKMAGVDSFVFSLVFTCARYDKHKCKNFYFS